MYFYLAYRGRNWNPAETLAVLASIYNDYENGDHVTPSGTEDFDGLTVVSSMYFYLAYRGRNWNPAETLAVLASIYNDYKSGDHVTPSGTEDFDGLTVVSSIDALSLVEAIDRGPVAIYSNLPKSRVMDRLIGIVWEGLE